MRTLNIFVTFRRCKRSEIQEIENIQCPRTFFIKLEERIKLATARTVITHNFSMVMLMTRNGFKLTLRCFPLLCMKVVFVNRPTPRHAVGCKINGCEAAYSPESHVNCQNFFNIICGQFVCRIWIIRVLNSHDTAQVFDTRLSFIKMKKKFLKFCVQEIMALLCDVTNTCAAYMNRVKNQNKQCINGCDQK